MKFLGYVFILIVCANLCFCADYIEAYYTQRLNHFSFSDDRTFQQHYLYNDKYFNQNNGPIFFYAGNRGDILSQWNNNGFLLDIAPLFQAVVVFCEHRYYGDSLPFGNDSFQIGENISYLTVEQALADYAVFLTTFKEKFNLTEKNQIVAFGGSYGGVLAAYMRFKYPNIVVGSIASSAPLYLYTDLTNNSLFYGGITNDFSQIPGCVDLVRNVYEVINATVQSPQGYNVLSEKFQLCNPIKTDADYFQFLIWTMNAMGSMALANYPYSTSIAAKLPAWPVNYACSLLANEISQGVDKIIAFKDLVGIFYNDTQTLKCFDIYAEYIECSDSTGCGLGNTGKAWDYQGCTAFSVIQNSNGVTDMFPALPYSEDIWRDLCKQSWNINVRPEWTPIEFWGHDISSASNIVFSNGKLDPFYYGGQLTDISETVVALTIPDGAQSYDLRGSDPADTPSVKTVRGLEIQYISQWLENI